MKSTERNFIKNSAKQLGFVLATGISVSGITFAKMSPVLGAHLYLTDFANLVNLDRETLNWIMEADDPPTEKISKLAISIALNLAEDPYFQAITAPMKSSLCSSRC